MVLINFIFDMLARIPMWLLFASPLILVLSLIGKRIPKNRQSVHVAFCGFGALILTPMPIGMFLALVPLAYVVWSGPAYLATVGWWLAISYPATFVLLYLVTRGAFRECT